MQLMKLLSLNLEKSCRSCYGVTKISEFENKAVENSKAENFRKVIIATSKDIRVLLVKIAMTS